MDCSTPGLPVHHQLLDFTQTPVHWVSDAIQPSHPLSSPSPPALNLSQHQGLFFFIFFFFKFIIIIYFTILYWICHTSTCIHHGCTRVPHPEPPPTSLPIPSQGLFKWALRIRWPKYWSFSFNISPSNEHPGLISSRMDWLDLLAVQGTLKSLLLHYSSKASILRCSAFLIVQLSHPYMTTGKTKALTRWTCVGKVMSLFLNMLSRLVITFLSKSKRLLISWLQSPSAVILEPPKYSQPLFPMFPHLFAMKWWDWMSWS